MEIFRFNILPDEEYTQRELFKMSVLNCQMCGSDLKFQHTKEDQTSVVHEEAHCPSCQIQLKTQTHKLH